MPERDPHEGLNAHLNGPRTRQMTREEIRKVFAPIDPMELLRKPDEYEYPRLVMLMWRIVRTTAMAKGLCGEDEMLAHALSLAEVDPWTQPLKAARGSSNPMAHIHGRGLLRDLHNEGEGLPLLPPRGPSEMLDRWCAATRILSGDLHMHRYSELQPLLPWLTEPEWTCLYTIGRKQVVNFEALIMECTQELLLEHGERYTINELRSKYHMVRGEAISCVRLARADAGQMMSSSGEQDRAMMLLQLTDLAAKARRDGLLTTELRCLKEIARVQGLGNAAAVKDFAKEFRDLVATISGQQDKSLLGSSTPRLLEGRLDRLNDPTPDDPEDAEALRAFDLENRA